MSAMQGQVGGDHYKTMGMQPFEFTMANRWDALAHTSFKYIARHAAKGGKTDLLKAIHCCEMRVELAGKFPPNPPVGEISVNTFIDANGLAPPERQALRLLTQWVYNPSEGAARTIEAIQELIAHRYP